MTTPLRLHGFYAICDLAPAADATTAVALTRQLLAAGPAALQLRHKDAGGGAMLACALAVQPLCRLAGVPFFVNDRLDVALAAGADGVHLGQEDLPLAVARRLGPHLLVGISTHTPAEARAAVAGGAAYVGCGPVFATATKPGPDPVTGLEGLAAVCAAVAVPVVAIGGLTAANAGAAIAAGATAVAVISAVNYATDVVGAGQAVAAACAAARAGLGAGRG